MSKYSEILKDPRWQKKRLEILQRDGWACSYCEDKTQTLVVHHKDYFPNKDPWDYPDNLLITLCENCHLAEAARTPTEQSLLHHLRRIFPSDALFIIDNGLEFLDAPLTNTDVWMLAEIIRWLLSSQQLREELDKRCWDMMHKEISKCLKVIG